MSKSPSPPLQTVELGVWEVVFFPVPEETLYSFFSFLFDDWNIITLANVYLLGEEDLVYDYLFTSQRCNFIRFGVIENRVTKIKCFNGN